MVRNGILVLAGMAAVVLIIIDWPLVGLPAMHILFGW